MRDNTVRDAFAYGEYAVPGVAELAPPLRGAGEQNGEPGFEFTRRMRSDIGVDFVLAMV